MALKRKGCVMAFPTFCGEANGEGEPLAQPAFPPPYEKRGRQG